MASFRNAISMLVIVAFVATTGQATTQGDKGEREKIAGEVGKKIAELPGLQDRLVLSANLVFSTTSSYGGAPKRSSRQAPDRLERQ